MPTAYSYIRFSSRQQKKGDSEARQGDGVIPWCDRNGYTLDSSLRADRGRSGYHGTNLSRGHLGSFLKRIEEGTVVPGSVLIIEHLDRLTRKDPDAGYLLISRILNHGVDVVTLMDGERYTAKRLQTDIGATIKIMLTLFQGHQESLKKSERITHAWQSKRVSMREGKSKHDYLPSWLDKDRNTIPEKVEVIRRMFAMAAEGKGTGYIVRVLNQEGVKPLKGSRWYEGGIKQQLKSRTVLGEYQPHRIVNERRIPEGDPITEFYPQIVDPATFAKVQQFFAERTRSNVRGENYESPNLFTGLLYSLYDGGRYHYRSQQAKYNGKVYPQHNLQPYAARDGARDVMDVTLYYDPFETAFFRFVREVDASILFSGAERSGKAAELDRLQSEVYAIDERIATVKTTIKESKNIIEMLKLVQEMDSDKQAKVQRMEILRSELLTSESRSFEEIRAALDDLGERHKVASLLRLMVDRIDLLPIDLGRRLGYRRQYFLYVEILFANGKRRVFVTDQSGVDHTTRSGGGTVVGYTITHGDAPTPLLSKLADTMQDSSNSIVEALEDWHKLFTLEGARKAILTDLIGQASEKWRGHLGTWLEASSASAASVLR